VPGDVIVLMNAPPAMVRAAEDDELVAVTEWADLHRADAVG
jgi:hypothetical protein